MPALFLAIVAGLMYAVVFTFRYAFICTQFSAH